MVVVLRASLEVTVKGPKTIKSMTLWFRAKAQSLRPFSSHTASRRHSPLATNHRRSAHESTELLVAMASRGRCGGLGGRRIGGGGDRDHIIHRPVAETPADRRGRIVRSEAAKKRAVRRYTNQATTR
jgi:hypothetical protein